METEPKNNNKSFTMGILTGMLAIIFTFAVVALFFPGVLNGMASITPIPIALESESPKPKATPAPLTIGQKVDEIMKALDYYYVEELDMDELSDKIYREIVQMLEDPYTSYMDPKQFNDFMEDTEGVYAGIGVSVSVDTLSNRIMVVVPFEGYPGAQAGMMPGDAIIKVNGYDVTGEMLQEAVSMMKGTPGTSVTVTIFRDSTGEEIEMAIIRELINVPTVSHKMLENDIGYLRISNFDRVTYDQFMSAYNDLRQKNMTGLILDLRNNPGGLLSIVSQITDVLVPEGVIVYTEDKYGNRNVSKSSASCIEVPLVVLVNEYSASASEILAGAIKDYGIGDLVGTTTYGKGLVQNIIPLSDKSAVKITIAKYYTPNGICLQGTGLDPDHEIEMELELTARISSLAVEDDIQLLRAIEIMNGKLK